MLQGIRNNILFHEKIDKNWTDLQPDDDERERMERFGETLIIYETDGFGLDFVKKM